MTALSDALCRRDAEPRRRGARRDRLKSPTLKADKESLRGTVSSRQLQQTAEDPTVMQQLADQADAISAELNTATQ
jgi:hypothetical protein